MVRKNIEKYKKKAHLYNKPTPACVHAAECVDFLGPMALVPVCDR